MYFEKLNNYEVKHKESINRHDESMLSFSSNYYLIEHPDGAFQSKSPVTLKQVRNFLKANKINKSDIYLIEEDSLVIQSSYQAEEEEEVVLGKELEEVEEAKETEEMMDEETVEEEQPVDYFLLTHHAENVKRHFKGWSEERPEPTKKKPYVWGYTKEPEDSIKKDSDPELIDTYKETALEESAD